MSVDSRTQLIDATGQLRLANANFLFLISASAAITITFARDGSTETFQNTLAGLSVARVRKWDYAFLQGAAGTSVTFFYGITQIREDATLVQQSLATIAGTVNVSSVPATALTDAANVALPNAALTAVVPVNLLRRRVSISIPSNSVGWLPNTVFFRGAAGVNNLKEIQPGLDYSFEGTYAISIRNDCGAALSAMITEES